MEKSNVFVYGTLMKGRRNHGLIKDSEYLGTGSISGFEMYDLGFYPAIVSGSGSVLGEVYAVDGETMDRLDILESNGELYKREKVRVKLKGGCEETEAWVYIYLYELEKDNESRIWEYMQPYGSGEDELVWYVSYGSNMCRERFMKYINGNPGFGRGKRRLGCTDKTPPRKDKGFAMHYEMYFGNTSYTWGLGGVAFLDKDTPNNTLGRAWLITKAQLRDIHRQECWAEGWYDAVICLPGGGDYPAFTITGNRRYHKNEPAKAYLEVIEKGRSERWGDEM